MSDVKCARCAELWDSYCLRIEKHDCETCNGKGAIELDEPELADGVDGSLHYLGNDECPTKECETCEGTGRTISGQSTTDYEWRVVLADAARLENVGSPFSQLLAVYRDARKRAGRRLTEDEIQAAIVGQYSDRCDTCSGFGHVDRPDTCETCGTEFDYGFPRGDTILVCDGYECLDCARKAGSIIDERECSDCAETGKVERGADALEPDEIRRFRKGEGCPACDFGSRCPQCDGRGHDRCYSCGGAGTVDAVKHPDRGWERPAPGGLSPCDAPTVTYRRYIAGWGTCDVGRVPCVTCFGRAPEPCSTCAGTGKLTVRDPETIALDTARSELDASDEEPIGILVNRGLL